MFSVLISFIIIFSFLLFTTELLHGTNSYGAHRIGIQPTNTCTVRRAPRDWKQIRDEKGKKKNSQI